MSKSYLLQKFHEFQKNLPNYLIRIANIGSMFGWLIHSMGLVSSSRTNLTSPSILLWFITTNQCWVVSTYLLRKHFIMRVIKPVPTSRYTNKTVKRSKSVRRHLERYVSALIRAAIVKLCSIFLIRWIPINSSVAVVL